MTMRQVMPGFLDAAGMSITALARLNKTVSIISGVLIPTIVGVFCTYYTELSKASPLLFWFPVLLFVFVSILFSAYTWDAKLPAEYLLEYLEANERYNQAAVSLRYFAQLQQLTMVWRSMSDAYVRDKINNSEDMRSSISVIMKLVVDSRESLFNCVSDELWNFGVYFYNKDADILYPIWRDRHPDHPSGTGLGRSWKPGIGHIGIAFSQGEARYTEDVQAPGIADLLRLPAGQARPYDADTYVSFISEPIPNGPDGRPWGVIVATSNVAGRFNAIKEVALCHTAAELATMLNLAYTGPVPI